MTISSIFVDPRRCDDNVDGAYDTCPDDDSDLVLPLSSGGSSAVARLAPKAGAPRKPVGHLANSTPLGTPRRVNFGHRWTWDLPLGHALDLLATQAEQLLLSSATQLTVPYPMAAVVFEPPADPSAARVGPGAVASLVPRINLCDPYNGSTDGFIARGGAGYGQLLAHIANLMVRSSGFAR